MHCRVIDKRHHVALLNRIITRIDKMISPVALSTLSCMDRGQGNHRKEVGITLREHDNAQKRRYYLNGDELLTNAKDAENPGVGQSENKVEKPF